MHQEGPGRLSFSDLLVILFATSIYENIRFGKENATRAEIEEAARQANAHNFIMQLPNKYATVVGERGIQLSGGEKQRVVLARALVKQPALLLLDEATSALDNTNEKIVQEALDQACQGRTTIVIAHRLSAVQNAHRIYVLGNGRVTEQGQRVALAGASGCGKSTVVQLLERFYDPVQGEIVLFGTSIYENIRFGKENATRVEIEEAARQASAHDFIMQLPNKYDTVVGERGVQLSGGEKQRVALARALVKQPALLLLDEATSALDNTNEKIVQEALDQACKAERSRHRSHSELGDKNKYAAFALSGSKLTERIRIKAFAHYLRQELAFFDCLENSSGAICNRLSSDALAVQQMVGSYLGIVCESVAAFGVGLVIGFFFSWQLALIVLFYIVVLFVVAFMQIRWQARLNKRCDCVLGLASSVRGACRLKYHVY
ncbi:unnamed protein product [Rotaria sp. Silwood1]|nr:unnamed protein product [Rotaria sp. Silwood1]